MIALGSCIGLLVPDPIAKVAGLLHFMLPDASLDAGRVLLRRAEGPERELSTTRSTKKGVSVCHSL